MNSYFKPEYLEDLRTAILDDVYQNVLDQGVSRFDVLQKNNNIISDGLLCYFCTHWIERD